MKVRLQARLGSMGTNSEKEEIKKKKEKMKEKVDTHRASHGKARGHL
jgi:hypothetical protein